jgi:TIR domain
LILILAQQGTEAAANAISAALVTEYPPISQPGIVSTDAVWSRPAEWDDLLLVVYNSDKLSSSAIQYIQAFRAAHQTGGTVIPVGVNPEFRKPPDPLALIKAAQYDGTAPAMADIVHAAGVFLGLSLRPGSEKIFVSYRATDGKSLARSIYDRLIAAGFDAWLDEAGENLVIGTDVQETIRKKLEEAAMVLLADTPDAPASPWVKIEVDLANSQLIPVLPIVAGGEQAPRFIQLAGLRRWALVKKQGLDNAPLSDPEWDGVRLEIDQLLLSTFRRRLRILSRARKVFQDQGYVWQPIDNRLRMYLSEKKISALQRIVAFSHCLVQDITFVPALQAWWNYVTNYQGLSTVNQKLCIYDREKVLSQPEIETLSANLPNINAILAHYNELELLVSKFG